MQVAGPGSVSKVWAVATRIRTISTIPTQRCMRGGSCRGATGADVSKQQPGVVKRDRGHEAAGQQGDSM
jgi:hypothetical protein